MAPQQVAKWQPMTHMGNAGVGSQGAGSSLALGSHCRGGRHLEHNTV